MKFTLRLDDEDAKQLTKLAKKWKTSLVEVLRRLIRERNK